MHPGSPSDSSKTAAAESKPRCVYSILKPHGQSFRRQVRLLLSQSRSQAVVCVSTPRMYPHSRYFLVKPKFTRKFCTLVFQTVVAFSKLGPDGRCRGTAPFPGGKRATREKIMKTHRKQSKSSLSSPPPRAQLGSSSYQFF